MLTSLCSCGWMKKRAILETLQVRSLMKVDEYAQQGAGAEKYICQFGQIHLNQVDENAKEC